MVLPSLVCKNSVTPDLWKWESCFAGGRAQCEGLDDEKQFCSVTVVRIFIYKHATEIHWQENEHLNARLQIVKSKKKEKQVYKLSSIKNTKAFCGLQSKSFVCEINTWNQYKCHAARAKAPRGQLISSGLPWLCGWRAMKEKTMCSIWKWGGCTKGKAVQSGASVALLSEAQYCFAQGKMVTISKIATA